MSHTIPTVRLWLSTTLRCSASAARNGAFDYLAMSQTSLRRVRADRLAGSPAVEARLSLPNEFSNDGTVSIG